MRIVDKVIDRLAELAAGDEPNFGSIGLEHGICFQIREMLCIDERWDAMGPMGSLVYSAFRKMGLDDRDPLGDFDRAGNHWIGKRGEKRRALCYQLMVQLIASAGYRGKYGSQQ